MVPAVTSSPVEQPLRALQEWSALPAPRVQPASMELVASLLPLAWLELVALPAPAPRRGPPGHPEIHRFGE
ncbi:MAG: hypothetical protein ABI877_20455 [Gemmatimonadaceae bacterium]